MKYTSSNEAPKTYHLPAGDYPVTIVEASETVSRSSGADMLKLTLLAEAPDGATAKLFDYLVASPSSAWKIDDFRRSIGEQVTPGEAAEINADELAGRTGYATLKVEEYNGKLSNKVEAWLENPAAKRVAPQPVKGGGDDDIF